ncbi:MAG: flippase [Candidatus Asgardarchaeia archaeon]
MSQKKKFVEDVTVTFISSAITLVISFLSSVILGRSLGPKDLGIYKMTLSIYNLAIVFTSFGLPSTVVKYIAESDEDRRKKILSFTLITSLLLGIATSLFLYVLSEPLSTLFRMASLRDTLLLISLIFPISMMNSILFSTLNGMRRMKLSAFISILQSTSMLALVIALVSNFRILGAICSFMASLFIASSLLIVFNRNLIKLKVDWKEYSSTVSELFRFSSKIFLSSSINILNYQIGTFVIGYFLTASDVGYYSVAVSLSQFFWLLPSSVQKITYPSTSSYWSKGEIRALKKMIDKSMKYTAIVLIPLGLLAGFLAKDLVEFLYGQPFLPSAPLLQILLIGTIFNGATSKPIAGTLSGIGRPDIELKRSVLNATINIVLTTSFVPILGSSGAAISRSLTFLIGSVIGLLLIRRVLSITIDTIWYVKVFSLSLLSTLIYISLKGSFSNLVSSLISVSLFTLLEVLFLIEEEDRKIISDIIREFRKELYRI